MKKLDSQDTEVEHMKDSVEMFSSSLPDEMKAPAKADSI